MDGAMYRQILGETAGLTVRLVFALETRMHYVQWTAMQETCWCQFAISSRVVSALSLLLAPVSGGLPALSFCCALQSGLYAGHTHRLFPRPKRLLLCLLFSNVMSNY
ncbi:hypothetical protein AMELA_G00147610 [Ameiurus melas]|uniref:Uncharacterized protein n=1 Tax=Ameiurus melas TaxID=219545 RepID=A0A7J6AGM7_AMEME|nr:hypothetical protein AMELA_G00147610 [Ameiurus melas]